MAGSNPTIVATITAEDKTKAAIATATAALREMNKAIKSVGQDKLPDNMFGGLDRELDRANRQMTALKDKMSGARREVFSLRDAFGEALRGLKPLAEMSAGMHLEYAGVETLKKAGEYAHAEILNAYAGMNPDQIERAKAATLEAQKLNPGLSMVSGQHLAGSLYSVMASNTEAEELFPTLMKYRAALRAKYPGESEEQIDERTHNTLKFGEAIGANVSADKLGRLLDKIQKAENFEGKMIRPDDLLALSKQAGASLKMLTESGQKTAIELVAEWGGDRTGTFIQALGKYAAGSGFDNHASALNELADAGLVDRNDLKLNKQGNPAGIKMGSASYYRMQGIGADPLAFERDMLIPALDNRWNQMSAAQKKLAEDSFKKNYSADVAEHPELALHDASGKEVDPSKLDAKSLFELSEIRRMFPNAVAARGLGEIFILREQLEAKQAKIDGALGIDKTLEQSTRDPVAQMQSFRTALSNLQTVLGSPLMETAASALNSLAKGVASFTATFADFQKAHPEIAKAIGVGATGVAVGGGLTLMGGVLGNLMNGFGLKQSATALDRAAAHLDSAAGRIAGTPGSNPPGSNAIASPVGKAWWSLPSFLGAVIGHMGITSDEDFRKQWEVNEKSDAAINKALYDNVPFLRIFDPEWRAKNWGASGTGGIANGEVMLNPNDPAAQRRAFDGANDFRRDPEGTLGRRRLELDARTATVAKAEVTGTVSGSVETVQHLEVTASPLLMAVYDKAKSLTVPLAGKLGTVMGGENGVRPAVAGINKAP